MDDVQPPPPAERHGAPHGPGCEAALEQLYVFLDGELTDERRSRIRTHLDRCVGCLEAYDFEAELRVVVSSCCRGDVLPEHLRARVEAALVELQDGT